MPAEGQKTGTKVTPSLQTCHWDFITNIVFPMEPLLSLPSTFYFHFTQRHWVVQSAMFASTKFVQQSTQLNFPKNLFKKPNQHANSRNPCWKVVWLIKHAEASHVVRMFNVVCCYITCCYYGSYCHIYDMGPTYPVLHLDSLNRLFKELNICCVTLSVLNS